MFHLDYKFNEFRFLISLQFNCFSFINRVTEMKIIFQFSRNLNLLNSYSNKKVVILFGHVEIVFQLCLLFCPVLHSFSIADSFHLQYKGGKKGGGVSCFKLDF